MNQKKNRINQIKTRMMSKRTRKKRVKMMLLR